jgi:superfamily I DNA/RNA helicase
MVGDFDQTINDFRHIVNTTACDQREHCVLPSESKTLDLSIVVEWYNTFRLDSLSVNWLEDMTGKRMQSARPRDHSALISWSSVIKHIANTLIICRKNESVVSEVLRHQQDGNIIHVINGTRIALLLKSAASDPNNKGCMSQLAEKLKKDNLLSQTLQILNDSDISLNTLKSGGFLAVGTVHQLKGFEYDHVAIHRDVLDCAAKEKHSASTSCDNTEKNSLFVALTRHKLSLTILYDITSTPQNYFNDTGIESSIFQVQQNSIFV